MQIDIKSICKNYGNKEVLQGVSLSLTEGMFGLLGRNGAGKTTFMKILATLTKPDSGEIRIDGERITNVRQIREILGYLPQEFGMYPNMRVRESLNYMGILSEMPPHIRKQRIDELLSQVNLTEYSHMKFKYLSGGMKRRLGIAQALLNDPRLLIVDEPTVGLDPEERIRFRNLLVELAGNRVVILSTHIAQDVEATCEKIGVLNQGKLEFTGKVEDVVGMAKDHVYQVLWSREEYEQVKKKYVILNSQPQGRDVLCRILSREKPCDEAESIRPTLEDGYVELLKGVDGNETLSDRM